MIDETKNRLLKEKVIERSQDHSFRHHSWFVKYHLEIVEQIAHELCEVYPEADKHYVDTLLWLHDYEKIIDFDNQYNTELDATRELMKEIGYSLEVIEEMADTINLYNAKNNLGSTKIEIQIVSSSDAASHLVGPFFALYWYENPSMTLEELQSSNRQKQTIDWDKKITLPEVKKAFESRHIIAKELAGDLPSSYLS